jgi:hypothetical protein
MKELRLAALSRCRPSFNGKVQQFTLTPRGEFDRLILTDGTKVKPAAATFHGDRLCNPAGRLDHDSWASCRGRPAASGDLHLRSHHQSARRRPACAPSRHSALASAPCSKPAMYRSTPAFSPTGANRGAEDVGRGRKMRCYHS